MPRNHPGVNGAFHGDTCLVSCSGRGRVGIFVFYTFPQLCPWIIAPSCFSCVTLGQLENVVAEPAAICLCPSEVIERRSFVAVVGRAERFQINLEGKLG
jgi:hypothetical protein